MEVISTLRTDVNFILERLSDLPRQVDIASPHPVQHQQRAALAANNNDGNHSSDSEVDPVVAIEAATDIRPNINNQASREAATQAQPSRPQTVTHAPRATAQSAARTTSRRSNRTVNSSPRSSRRTSNRVKHEDSTETDTSDPSDSDDPHTADVAHHEHEQAPDFSEISFHNRRKGPKHLHLDSLVPSEERFDRLLSYRYYRLHKTNSNRSNTTMNRVHKILKNLELTMRDYKFSGEDPILIFDFLSRLV